MGAGASAVFLDRDGVLNEIVERDGAPGSPRTLQDLRLVADIEAARRLRAAGLLVFIVTNQPDVARGLLPEADLDEMMRRVVAAADVHDYRVCVHEDRHDCACRKPRPGMILDLARRWQVDAARSCVIGDMWRDVEAARAAGSRSVLIRRPYNRDVSADYEAETLNEAVEIVLGELRSES
jgi:D-glycero-D-manno-heptose 1,7-bisphosphate phosphatase